MRVNPQQPSATGLQSPVRLFRLSVLLAICLFADLILAADTLLSNSPVYDPAIDNGTYGAYPLQKFKTSPVTAPRANFLTWSPECRDGLYHLLTPKGWSVSDPGPMILDQDGTLIWSQHYSNQYGGQAYNLQVQSYKGEDYLTFWLGDDTVRGHGAGTWYMLNSSYDVVHKVGAANGMFADLHEFTITPQGTVLMTLFDTKKADTRPVGRKYNDLWNQYIWDGLVQEIDIETQKLVFEWRASDHINLTETYKTIDPADGGTQQNPFDFYHINSVDKDELGNYLVSARNMHSLHYVDGKTGQVLWTLGGKGNDFKDLSGGIVLKFAWQHNARFAPIEAFPQAYEPPQVKPGVTTKLITLFDNAALDWDYSYGTEYSRGLLIELTFPTQVSRPGQKRDVEKVNDAIQPADSSVHSALDAEKLAQIDGKDSAYTVRIIRQWINPTHIRSSTQGSLQLVPQGSGHDPQIFIGYGINAAMTTFDSSGIAICDVHFGAETSFERGDIQSYRAHKASWVGQPTHPPEAGVRSNIAYVSWNGATEYRQWLLQVSPTKQGDTWTDVVRVPKHGFETTIQIAAEHQATRYVRLVALDSSGQQCQHGTSNVVDRGFVSSAVRQRLGDRTPSMSQTLLLSVGSIMIVVALYQVYRRTLHWRRGRPLFGKQRRKGSHDHVPLQTSLPR